MNKLRILSFALAATLCVGGVSARAAQINEFDPTPESRYDRNSLPEIQEQPGANGPVVIQINDDDLKNYASALIAVLDINDTYQDVFEQAQSEEEQDQIASEALGKMAQAVEDEGLTVEKYRLISDAARSDPQIGSRIAGYVRDKTSE
jgi:hypothetical protein